MKKLHRGLSKHLPWYKAWHKEKHASSAHWTIFILLVILVGLAFYAATHEKPQSLASFAAEGQAYIPGTATTLLHDNSAAVATPPSVVAAINYPIGGEIWKLNSVDYPSKQTIRWLLPDGVTPVTLKISQSNKNNCTTTPCAVYRINGTPISGKYFTWIVGNAYNEKGQNIKLSTGYYRFILGMSNGQTVQSGQIYIAPAPIVPKE